MMSILMASFLAGAQQQDGKALLTREERMALAVKIVELQSPEGKKKLAGSGDSLINRVSGNNDFWMRSKDLNILPSNVVAKVRTTRKDGAIVVTLDDYDTDRFGFRNNYTSKSFVIVNFSGLSIAVADGDKLDGFFVPTGYVRDCWPYGKLATVELIEDDDPKWMSVLTEASQNAAKKAEEARAAKAKFDEEMRQSNERQEAIAAKLRKEREIVQAKEGVETEVATLSDAMTKSCDNLARATTEMQETFSTNAIKRHIGNLEKAKAKAKALDLDKVTLDRVIKSADAAIAKGKRAIGAK